MQRSASTLMLLLSLSGCTRQAQVEGDGDPATQAATADASGWRSVGDTAGDAIEFVGAGNKPQLRIICAGPAKLIVNVPGFSPIGSEERLSLGGEKDALAMVADSRGDRQRGGVSAETRITGELKSWLLQPLSASYGRQNVGPVPAVPAQIAGPLLRKCSGLLERERIAATVPTPGTSPCLVQDGRVLAIPPFKAVGTEPFWAARVQGRCVTYSTPEDQAGTRIWTKVESGPMGPIFAGALHGKPFAMRIQPATHCSDGMSDKDYGYDVALTVGGEERQGCAEIQAAKK